MVRNLAYFPIDYFEGVSTSLPELHMSFETEEDLFFKVSNYFLLLSVGTIVMLVTSGRPPSLKLTLNFPA